MDSSIPFSRNQKDASEKSEANQRGSSLASRAYGGGKKAGIRSHLLSDMDINALREYVWETEC